jgi:hypothetical protein
MRKILASSFALVLSALVAGPSLAKEGDWSKMHFTDSVGVSCGSEATARQWFYEYDHGLPFTVFKDDPTQIGSNPKTADGASCAPNLIALVHPLVSVLARHGAYCNIRVHEGDLERITMWTMCNWLQFD